MSKTPLQSSPPPHPRSRATLLSLRRSRPPPHTVGAVAVVAALVGVGVYWKKNPLKNQPPGGGQAQGGVALYDSESQKRI